MLAVLGETSNMKYDEDRIITRSPHKKDRTTTKKPTWINVKVGELGFEIRGNERWIHIVSNDAAKRRIAVAAADNGREQNVNVS